MNWVSYTEDIEELRQEHEHYRRGMDSLIERLKADPAPAEINRVEWDYRQFADRLIKKYEGLKEGAETQFQAAIRILRDPSVRVTERLNKRTRERNELRVELQKCKSELELCRASQARNLNKIGEMGREATVLRQQLAALKDQNAWTSELASVKPRK